MREAGQTWLVVGASSAIAREFARAAAGEGADVLLAGRDQADLEASAADIRLRAGRQAGVLPFAAEEAAGHAGLIAHARQSAGAGTLNLFFAVGTMPDQGAIDADPALQRATLAANLTGAISLLQAAAPVFEAQRAGRIVALGSVAGDRGRPKNYVYGAAKAGLAAYLQGLRARLWRYGVTVTTVKPGFVDTAMTFGLPGLFLVASPRAVARACLRAAQRGREVIYVPWFWRPIMALLRAIPEPIFKRLDI